MVCTPAIASGGPGTSSQYFPARHWRGMAFPVSRLDVALDEQHRGRGERGGRVPGKDRQARAG